VAPEAEAPVTMASKLKIGPTMPTIRFVLIRFRLPRGDPGYLQLSSGPRT